MEFVKRTWAEIDLDALAYNVANIKKTFGPNDKMMGIVKADAYGHGDGFVSRKLMELGVEFFGVACIDEALGLRREGITKDILILSYTPAECAKMLAENDITQAIVSLEHAKALNDCAVKDGVTVKCHIKLDTGMSRVGFQTAEEFFDGSLKEILEVCKLSNLNVTGMFTHHAVADSLTESDIGYTKMQFERFDKMENAVKAAGVELPFCHCANSATTIGYLERHKNLCRCGVILYGLTPSPDTKHLIELKPIMTVKSTLSLVKTVPPGTELSYGRHYKAPTERRIATVPIGYADGYNRRLTNQGQMILKGKIVPVVGRVCMDQLMIDVTDVPDAKMGDEVIVIGSEGGHSVTFDGVAEMLGTINYELSCAISKRVPRIYKENGKIVGIVNHVLHRYQ